MGNYSRLIDDEQVLQWKKRLSLMWAFMVVYAGACTLLSIQMGDCNSGSPDILYWIAGGLVSTAWVWQLCMYWQSTPWQSTTGYPKLNLIGAIVVGGLTLMDFFTDSQQISLAALCDANFHDNWVLTFKDASFPPWLVHSVDTLHMAGFLFISVFLNIIIQLNFVILVNTDYWNFRDYEKSWYYRASSGCTIIADFVGLGGFVTWIVGVSDCLDEEQQRSLALLRGATAGIFENLPSLYLSTSLFSLTFDETNEKAKNKQLVSLFLSFASTSGLAVSILHCFWKDFRRQRQEGSILTDCSCGSIFTDCFAVFLPLLYCMAAVVLCIVCAFRVYFSYICDSHLWNLSSGCVESQ